MSQREALSIQQHKNYRNILTIAKGMREQTKKNLTHRI